MLYCWAGTYLAKTLWGSKFHSIPPFSNRGIDGKLDPHSKMAGVGPCPKLQHIVLILGKLISLYPPQAGAIAFFELFYFQANFDTPPEERQKTKLQIIITIASPPPKHTSHSMQKAPEEPRLPKTKQEKDKGGRLIVILVSSFLPISVPKSRFLVSGEIDPRFCDFCFTPCDLGPVCVLTRPWGGG
jgi:hypothetical protein